MCGIVGSVSSRDVAPILVESLSRLEYRGYDSAGLAIIKDNQIERIRTTGRVEKLNSALMATPILGTTGIAHTRWATHGEPSENNAHPHLFQDSLALVHNGIIENYVERRQWLASQSVYCVSDTDSEVIVQCIGLNFQQSQDLIQAVSQAIETFKGAYSIALMSKNHPGRLIAARKGAPLVLGIGVQEHFVASDMLALVPFTQKMVILEEGDIVDIYQNHYQIYDELGKPVTRAVREYQFSKENSERGEYRHFMQKEIFEQPVAICQTLESRLGQIDISPAIFGNTAAALFEQVQAVQLIACGTSYYAAMLGKFWLENYVGIHADVDIASEIRFKKIAPLPNTLLINISQSGETADTLAALKALSPQYLSTMAICNVPESALVRACEQVLLTHAGPEVGVASTKAFTAQLTGLLLFVGALLSSRPDKKAELELLLSSLRSLPVYVEAVLKLDKTIAKLAERFCEKQHALFLGRGDFYPVALEGALKLKEISYIHAEAYPAGELKHGPLALVDRFMPVVALCPQNALFSKMKSSIQEVLARGGEVFVFTTEGSEWDDSVTPIYLPEVPACIAPIIYTIPLQLLAYHVALLKGTDVDRPRNLAKSVTVE